VSDPYESLVSLARQELELLADGRLDEVAELAQRFDELAATLPGTPPESARHALEATEQALVSSVAQLEAGLASVRVELARLGNNRRVRASYGATQPAATLDAHG
jgi:hypothetical protein